MPDKNLEVKISVDDSDVSKFDKATSRMEDSADDLVKKFKSGRLSADDLKDAFLDLAGEAGPVGLGIGTIVASLALLKAGVDKLVGWDKVITAGTQALGGGGEVAAGYALAMEQIGESAESALGGLQQFSGRLREAQVAGGGALDALKAFGVSVTDINTLKPDQILLKVADGYGKIANEATRAKATSDIFGDDDAVKFGLIADRLAQITKQAQQLGLVLGPDAKRQIAEYKEQVGTLSAQWDAFTIQAGQKIIPSLTGIAQVINEELSGKRVALPAFFTALSEAMGSTGRTTQETDEVFKGLNQGMILLDAMTPELRQKFEEFAKATGQNTAQLALATKGSEAHLQALTDQREGGQKATEQQQQMTIVHQIEKEKLGALVAERSRLTQELEKQIKVVKELATLQENDLRNQLSSQEITETEFADQLAKIKIKPYQAEVDAANAAFLELKARQSAGLISQQDYETEFDKLSDRMAKARTARDDAARSAQSQKEQAYAEERARQLKLVTDQLDISQKKRLNQIEEAERTHTITHAQAEDQRLAATRNRIDLEILLIQRQLEKENLGADEKQKLNDQLTELRKQADLAQLDSTKSRIAQELKDEQDAIEKKKALTDQQVAKQQILINQARERGATEQELARLTEQSLQLQLTTLNAVIAQKRQEGATEAEIIQLETERLRLVAQLGQAHAVATGQIVQGQREQTQAIEGSKQAVVDYITVFTSQGSVGLPGAAKQAVKQVTEEFDELGNQINVKAGELAKIQRQVINAPGMQFDPHSLDSLNAAIEQLRTNIHNLSSPNIAGVGSLGFLASLWRYNDQLKEVLQVREDLLHSQAETERKELEAQARETADALNRIHDDEIRDKQQADERYAESRDRIREQMADADRDLAETETRIRTDGQKRLDDIQKDWDDRRAARAKSEAERLLSIEADLQRSIRDTRSQRALDSFDTEQERIVAEEKAKRDLAEALASGDTDQQKEAQQTLDDIAAGRDRDQRRASEEDLARSQATSDEELQILLDSIARKYQSEEDYYNQRRALGDNASAEALAKLRASNQRELAEIEKVRLAALSDLQKRLADEKSAREQAAAEEDAEYQDRLNKQRKATEDELIEARAAHAKKIAELKTQLSEIKEEHKKALDSIRQETESALKAMGKSWEDYANFVNQQLGRINSPAGPGQQPSSSSGAGAGGGGGASVGGQNQPPSGPVSGSGGGGSPSGGASQQPATTPPGSPPPGTPPSSPPTGPTPSTGGDKKDKYPVPKSWWKRLYELARLADAAFERGDTEHLKTIQNAFDEFKGADPRSDFAKERDYYANYVATKIATLGGGPTPSTGSDSGTVTGTGPTDKIPGGGLGPPPGGPPSIDDPPGRTPKGTPTGTTEGIKAVDKFGGDDFQLPTSAQLIVQRVFKGELTREQALKQWDDLLAGNIQLRPYDKTVRARLTSAKPLATDKIALPPGEQTTDFKAPASTTGVRVPALPVAMQQAAKARANAPDAATITQHQTYNIQGENFEQIVEKLRRAAKQVSIKGA